MAAHQRPLQLLLIEDHRPDARLVEEHLKDLQAPYQLSLAVSATAACAQVGDGGAAMPDLILLSNALVREQWPEAVAMLAQHPKLGQVPIVLLTGLPGVEAESQRGSQVVAVLAKPLELPALVTLLQCLGLLSPGGGV